MSKLITITDLQRAAETYDNTLRKLPYLGLSETLNNLGITMLEVDGKDKVVVYHRKGGLARPYTMGSENQVLSGDIGKAFERVLDPQECYTALKDHILNYKAKRVISNASEKPDRKAKDHPLELLIIDSKVKTVGEDIITALFHAKRDEVDKSPMGMFDGFNEQIDKEVAAGEIAPTKGNLKITGAFSAPVDDNDMTAFNTLVDFLRSASPFLRKNGILYITQNSLFHCMDALGNKLKYKNALEYDVFLKHLQGITQAPNLKLFTDPALGSGSRLMYTVPYNLDFGVGTAGEEQFVQIRAPYEDPNIVQFWMQWMAGTRITSIHAKEFMTNEQVNTSEDLSGDYKEAPVE